MCAGARASGIDARRFELRLRSKHISYCILVIINKYAIISTMAQPLVVRQAVDGCLSDVGKALLSVGSAVLRWLKHRVERSFLIGQPIGA